MLVCFIPPKMNTHAIPFHPTLRRPCPKRTRKYYLRNRSRKGKITKRCRFKANDMKFILSTFLVVREHNLQPNTEQRASQEDRIGYTPGIDSRLFHSLFKLFLKFIEELMSDNLEERIKWWILWILTRPNRKISRMPTMWWSRQQPFRGKSKTRDFFQKLRFSWENLHLVMTKIHSREMEKWDSLSLLRQWYVKHIPKTFHNFYRFEDSRIDVAISHEFIFDQYEWILEKIRNGSSNSEEPKCDKKLGNGMGVSKRIVLKRTTFGKDDM